MQVTSAPTRGASRLEILACAGLIVLSLAVLTHFAWGGRNLWNRPFWMDELCCTVFPIIDSPSLRALIENVTRYDIGPPLYHAMIWTVGRIVGSLSPVLVRSVGIVSTCLALLILYVIVRRRWGRAASAAAIVVVASQPFLIHHTFDARTYGPWLLFGAAYAWSLGLHPDRPRSRLRDILQAIFAVLICAVHWFGIISLALMAAGAAAAKYRWNWREGLRFVIPSVSGLVALLLLSPMMITQLRNGGEEILWVPPLDLEQLWDMTQHFYVRVPLAIVIVLLLVDRFRRGGPRATLKPIFVDPSLAAVGSLLLIPLALLVVTVVLEPVFVPRYAILASMGAAPVVAAAIDPLGRMGKVLAIVSFGLILRNNAIFEARFTRHFAIGVHVYRSELERLRPENVPLVFQSFFTMYAIEGPRRSNAIARVIELPDSTIDKLYPHPSKEPLRRQLRVERGFSRLHKRVFGFPTSITLAQLDTTARFYLLASVSDLPKERRNMLLLGRRLFPRHRLVTINPVITLFERVPSR